MAAPHPFQNLITNFSPGERIFSEGEVGTTMFIVQSGRVRLFHEATGSPVAIAEMEKGDFFGEMSLLEAIPRNMSAEAIDSTELIEINSTTFDRMIRSNIEIAVRMLRKLSARLQKTEAQLASLKMNARREDAGASQAAAANRSASQPATVPIPHLHPPAPAPSPAAGHPHGAAAASTSRTLHGPAPATPLGSAGTGGPVSTPAPTISPKPGPGLQAASSGHSSLSATRPPSRSMQGTLSKMPAPGSGSVRIFPARATTGQGPRLVSESGETIFPLSTHEALLGRYDPVTETQPEVDLTLIDIKRSVSRRHARITSKDGGFYLIEEVGALNGTFINGVKVITGQPAPLKDNDRVSVGTVNLVFRI